MRISRFDSNLDRLPKTTEVSWDELVEQLRDVHRAPCTTETCGRGEHEHVYIDRDGHERRGGCKHKYIGAWSPAVYPGGATRAKRSVESVSVLVADLDHLTDDDVQDFAARVEPYCYVAHATHGDRPGDRALRLLVRLSEPVQGSDWPRFWPAAMSALGLPADPQTCDASRLYFLPTRPSDLDYLFEVNDGQAIDVARVLASAPEVAVIAKSPTKPLATSASEPRFSSSSDSSSETIPSLRRTSSWSRRSCRTDSRW